MQVDMQALYNAIVEVRPAYKAMTDDEIIKEFNAAETHDESAMWELMLERERRNI